MDTPQKMRIQQSYTEGDKFKVVATFVTLGSLAETAKQCDVPYDTLKSWKKQQWWPRMLAQVRGEENAKISARYRNIVLKTQEKLLERIEHGDLALGRDGSLTPIPVRGRDLAVIAGIATSQLEKLESAEQGEETITMAERLAKLAEEFVKFNKMKKPQQIIDVVPIEETDDEGIEEGHEEAREEGVEVVREEGREENGEERQEVLDAVQ